VKRGYLLALAKVPGLILAPLRIAALLCAGMIFVAHSSSLVEAEEASAFSRAVAAYKERNLDKALQYGRDAVVEDPDHADAHVLLGQVYYLRQDLGRAKDSWERALRLDPSRKDVRQALERLEREARIEKGLSRNDTHPFVVRSADEQSPVESGSLRQMLREVYRQVGQQFDYFPDHAIPVLLYPEADFEKVKGLSHQVSGLYDGKIRLPLKPGRTTGQELERVLWHEYTHALIQDLAKGRCPLWLNEGLASVQESRVLPLDLTLARKALEEKRLPAWDQFFKQGYRPAALAEDYQVAFLIADYLTKRWSWQEMVRLLKRLGQGASLPDAIRAQYHTDLASLEQEWRQWLRHNL